VPIRRSLLILAALLAFQYADLQAASRHRAPGAELQLRVETTLGSHLDGERIAAWLETLPTGTLERDAADWILAWLPLSDLAELDLPLLREHVEVAAESYRDAPWREELPRDIWLHFVAPHRVSQEPAQAWRRAFRDELWPRVKDAENMEAAALAVNRWCREQATFKSTNGRDQGPLTTVARGIGRCEEEMILTISALRAAGIPARSCATPYWSFTDNNHAWVETWADGQWWYLGGCEPDRCLNRAWFTQSASRTGFVRSVAYGEFDPAPEPLYLAEEGSTIINSTSVYTDPIQATARLAGDWADPEGWIRVNVLNFGSLRPVARIRSGDTIALGPGEYAFTAGDGETLLLETAGGRSGEAIDLTLDDDDRYDLAVSPGFWLRYPESDARPARDLDLVGDTERDRLKRNIAHRDGDRAKLRAPGEAEIGLLAALPPEQRERFDRALEKPFTHVSTLFALLEDYPDGANREALLAFLDAADDKDLLELDGAGIRSHIDAALEIRDRLGLAMPDSIFAEGLLACRIAREPGGSWREALPLLAQSGDSHAFLQSILDHWADRTSSEERGFFGAPLNPAQSHALGRGTERDLKVGLVGLLRRNGFPARYRHGKVETWLGEWLGLDALKGEVQEAGGEGESGEMGRLEITMTRGGDPYSQAESYRHFNVARPKEGWLESPWWDPAQGEQDWDAGDFILSSASRVPGGSIYGRLRAFTVEAGGITRVELPVDIAAGWEPGDTFFSGPTVALFSEAVASAGLIATGNQLTLLFERGEPALRMIEAHGRLAPRLADLGIVSRAILVADGDQAEEAKSLLVTLRSSGFSEIGHLPREAVEAWQEGQELEPIASLEVNGVTRYLRSGFDTAMDGNLHMVLDLYGEDR
jgi:transglutaminase-like putative cysteine protease